MESNSMTTNRVEVKGINNYHESSSGEQTNRRSIKEHANNIKKKATPQRRPGKKDRHSKIYTAQGPRDRRMRLSVQIARKFFDLQDKLGFDKASKTIEWLFSKSKAAIKDLNNSGSSTSSSECDYNESKQNKQNMNSLARESRERAKARARERTLEKMKSSGPYDLSRQGNASHFEDLGQLGSSFAQNKILFAPRNTDIIEDPNRTQLLQDQHMDSVSMLDQLLRNPYAPRSNPTSNFFPDTIVSDSVNFEVDHELQGFPVNSIGTGAVLLQNPNATFAPVPSCQEHMIRASASSFAMTSNLQEQDLDSIFLTKSKEQGENPCYDPIRNSIFYVQNPGFNPFDNY